MEVQLDGLCSIVGTGLTRTTTTVPGPGDRAIRLLRRGGAVVLSAVLAGGSLVACSSEGTDEQSPSAESGALPQGSESVEIDPADFTLEITNRYWPMAVGDRWVYEETDGEGATQRVEVTVLDQTKAVAAGVVARVVHDLVTEDGATVEDTLDYYAQDVEGNLWYFGEDTKEYENGVVVSSEGSWEAGVDGAQPGVVVPADPQPGMAYRQEYLEGEAEDRAEVLSTTEQVDGPTGSYSDVLMTEDTTPLEPDLAETKYYAPGVGPVLVVQTAGGSSRETLVETSRTPG